MAVQKGTILSSHWLYFFKENAPCYCVYSRKILPLQHFDRWLLKIVPFSTHKGYKNPLSTVGAMDVVWMCYGCGMDIRARFVPKTGGGVFAGRSLTTRGASFPYAQHRQTVLGKPIAGKRAPHCAHGFVGTPQAPASPVRP